MKVASFVYGFAVSTALLIASEPVLAACKGWIPGPKPQNVGRDIVGQDYDTIIERGYVTIGVYEDFAPYSFKSKGKLKGVDVEVGKLIAKGLGVEPRFRSYMAGEKVEDDLRNNVWKGHYIGGAVVNVMMHVPYDPEFSCRIEQAVFTGQYYNEKVGLAYRTDIYPDDVPLPAFFRFDKVGVEVDSMPAHYLSGFAGGQLLSNIVRFTRPAEAMEALSNGELAAVMGLRSQLEYGANGDPVTVAEDPLFPGLVKKEWAMGVAVSHTYRQLAYAVGDAVSAAVKSGEVEQVFKDHGLSWTPPSW